MRIAIFSLIDWDFVNQRPQAFARELARRGHEILYVEPSVLLGDFDEWIEQRRAGDIGTYQAERGIWVAEGTMIPFRTGYRELYPHNRDLAAATARWLAQYDLDFAILLSPEYTPVVAELGIPCAYDHVDETQYMDGVDTDAYVQSMEELKTLTTFNIYIQQPAAESDPKGFFLPNGVDANVFFPIDRPKLFDGVVLSTIARWFDMDSVLGAQSRILLIGPMDHDEGDNRKRLFEARRPNLHWIPQVDKPTANLWLSSARVGVVPFRLNHPVIPYAMPIKILEYFMAGLPVVTYRSEGIERFYGDRVTYYSTDGCRDPCLDEAIELAMKIGANHRAFALEYTWEKIVTRLDQHIAEELRNPHNQPKRRRVSPAPNTPVVMGIGAPAHTSPAADAPQAATRGAGSARAPDAESASRRYIARLQRQLQLRTEWAINLNREAQERAEWAVRLQRERDEQAEWARQLRNELEERTKWALRLKQELEKLSGQKVELPLLRETAAPGPLSSPPWQHTAQELAFIRQQWWFRLFSPGWRGWLRWTWRRVATSRRPDEMVPSAKGQIMNAIQAADSASEPDPLVSIIVLNWNGLPYLSGCFGSLRKQMYRNFEVIMVDNGSSDGSVDYVREHFPEVRIIQNEQNLGFAAGNNVGIRQANGDLIGLLNNDVEVAPTWLEELVRAIRSSERIAGVCGKVCALGDWDRVIFTLTKIDPESAFAYWINQDSPPRPVDYLAGNSLLVRRSVIEEVGLLDEAYFAYYEDTDWSARMIRAGYELLYVPTAVIAHKEMGTSSPDLHYYLMTRNRLRFALKNFDWSYLPRFLARYSRDLLREITSNRSAGLRKRNRLLLAAILWNLRHLPGTVMARRADRRRMRAVHSYNRSLPLRTVRCTTAGGYTEELPPFAPNGAVETRDPSR